MSSVTFTSVFRLLTLAAMLPTLADCRSMCGVKKPAMPKDAIPWISRIKHSPYRPSLGRRSLSDGIPNSIQIDTFVHVLSNSTDSPAHLSYESVMKQIRVLNDDFSPTGFFFKLIALDWMVEPKWASASDESAYAEMQTALNKGDTKTLNLYIVEQIAPPSVASASEDEGAVTSCGGNVTARMASLDTIEAGLSTFPWNIGLESMDNFVMVAYHTVPGCSNGHYTRDLGRTATHEVGHWLGLLHTFDEDCDDGFGDFVVDTPDSASATAGCPEGRDSYPDRPGLDPIHNFMDFSDDNCMSEFTPGQIKRMHLLWNKYRDTSGEATIQAVESDDPDRCLDLCKYGPYRVNADCEVLGFEPIEDYQNMACYECQVSLDSIEEVTFRLCDYDWAVEEEDESLDDGSKR